MSEKFCWPNRQAEQASRSFSLSSPLHTSAIRSSLVGADRTVCSCFFFLFAIDFLRNGTFARRFITTYRKPPSLNQETNRGFRRVGKRRGEKMNRARCTMYRKKIVHFVPYMQWPLSLDGCVCVWWVHYHRPHSWWRACTSQQLFMYTQRGFFNGLGRTYVTCEHCEQAHTIERISWWLSRRKCLNCRDLKRIH